MPIGRRVKKDQPTGYAKYIDWRIFVVPVVLLVLVLALPATDAMKDVGTEYSVGPRAVQRHLAAELFRDEPTALLQWQLLTVQIMERSLSTASLSRARFLEKDAVWCKKNGIAAEPTNLEKARRFVGQMGDGTYRRLLEEGASVRMDTLSYGALKGEDKKTADKGIWKLQVSLGILAFVVVCFLTACIPLPAVAFCIGLIAVLTGIVGREDVAAMYWSDSVWFIMGSLMFATAFVKTGVDKRICTMLFRRLAVPKTSIVVLIFIFITAPLSSFISDHALAAIFLPVGILLYQSSQQPGEAPDANLAKLLAITMAMGPNIGGFGAPSGGARNVIMMTYLQEMFGMEIGYFQWVLFGMPFVLVMIPVTWLILLWRFKPRTRDLTQAMGILKKETDGQGGWTRAQGITLAVFLATVWFWMTEESFFRMGIYPVRLGVGVIALGAGVTYILTGTVNWRDYHEKVDWGVVWLYGGAILFGRLLDTGGGAYLIARGIVSLLGSVGMDQGAGLLAASGVLTGAMTQLMADGPAAAAVGPVTLNVAAMVHPGTTMVPFMALATACASSFAYCLIIGTPPNAIVYASGVLSPRDFLKVGIPLWIVAQTVLILMALFYWPLLGFAGLPGF